ncbi:MAG: integron [Proteobacteria bacterium]|nr:integron [Pseudomonadota bacterium]MBS0555596.1 integron [Pseudomonadota bacterium]
MGAELGRWVAGALTAGATALAMAAGHARADAPAEVPVMIGGEAELDACASTGIVSGLRGGVGSFLAVRRGPGLRFATTDRLRNGARLWLCDARGGWLGVVYAADGRDCGVSSPQPARQPYRGPCTSGWVSERFVRREAG